MGALTPISVDEDPVRRILLRGVEIVYCMCTVCTTVHKTRYTLRGENSLSYYSRLYPVDIYRVQQQTDTIDRSILVLLFPLSPFKIQVGIRIVPVGLIVS